MSTKLPAPAFRTLPHNVEAEKALLGAIFANNRAFEAVSEFLRPEHFALRQNGRIYAACGKIIVDCGQIADPITLKGFFEQDETLKEIGGPAYLAELAASAVGIINATEYGRLVYNLHLKRELIAVGEALVEETYAAPVDQEASSILTATEERLFALAESGRGGQEGARPIADYVAAGLRTAEAAYKAHAPVGLSTGFKDIDAILGGLHATDLIILGGRPSMGKAQPLTSKILMRDGTWKTIGDLRIGDELASVDGAPSRVAGIFPRGLRQVYRVTMSDGRATRTCGEHLWAVESCRFEGPQVLTTDDIRTNLKKERYQRRMSFPLAPGHFGKDEGLLIDPWLLGALIGNGCMTEKHRKLVFSTADAATLYRVQKVIGHDYLKAVGNGYDYRINRAPEVGVLEALQAYGLSGKRSFEKFIPEPYLRACRETRMEVLRGLLDTDGWVETFGAVRFATSSARLALDLQALVRSIGGVCKITKKRPIFNSHGKKKNGLPSYVCNISHSNRASLLSLRRKQRRSEKPIRFRQPTIVSVEADGEEETRCIFVTHPNRLYITDDFIVTHNTALAMNIGFSVAGIPGIEPVLCFELEMSGEQLTMREIAGRAGLSSHRVRLGRVGAEDFNQMIAVGRDVGRLPLFIDERPALSISSIRTTARRVKRTHGLSFIIVDYLQLMGGAAVQRRGGDTRTQEVGEMTRGLKALAKDIGVPVLAVSQLSRGVEARENKRPLLADLRECVSGDTLLTDADTGSLVAIRDISVGQRILGVAPSLKIAAGPVAAVWCTGRKTTRRLTTKTGRTIEATDNHPFLTFRGWVPLCELRPDDRIAVAHRLPEHGTSRPGMADACRLLGYLAGNGSIQEYRTLGLIIPDAEAFADASAIISRMWPEVDVKIRANGYNDAWISRTYENGYGKPFGNPMREWLRDIGLIGTRDDTKFVPDVVFRAGKIGAAQFLAGYLETDGCVTNTGDRWSVRFDTTSRRLAQNAAHLLARVGVFASISKPTLSALARRPIYRISLAGNPANLRQFVMAVDARGIRGRRLKAMLLALKDRDTRHDAFALPPDASTFAASVSHRFRDQGRGLGRARCAEIAQEFDNDVMRQWAESDFIWDRVRGIEAAGEQDVFDIRIPGIHSFLANGIAVHNSGSIEQDADVVMFVFREEYYVERDKPERKHDESDDRFGVRLARWEARLEKVRNLAEVIIAKQRQGPIGTAHLRFNPETTRFNDLQRMS